MTNISFSDNSFDVLFRNLFEAESHFNTLSASKSPHPVDLYEDSNGLHFEIACTGLHKEDVHIEFEGDILKVKYNKPVSQLEELQRTYQLKGIAKRSFNVAYKISAKYNLVDSEAIMENGLLIINIPFAETAKPKKLTIK